MDPRKSKNDGPGVPEALPQALALLRERLGVDRLDTLWLFPPMIKGRSERGLVVASCFEDGTDGEETGDADRRLLHTLTYQAERTGSDLNVSAELFEEGLTPQDRVGRVIRGVVRRTEAELGDPRDVQIQGDSEEFERLVAELTPPPLKGVPA